MACTLLVAALSQFNDVAICVRQLSLLLCRDLQYDLLTLTLKDRLQAVRSGPVYVKFQSQGLKG